MLSDLVPGQDRSTGSIGIASTPSLQYSLTRHLFGLGWASVALIVGPLSAMALQLVGSEGSTEEGCAYDSSKGQ
jgi:hypothetical protein